MASRTQLVCLCEGEEGRSIDPVFINALMKALKPGWLRRQGSNAVRLVPCGSRAEVIERMPHELRNCLRTGGDTTLMVWADCDHDCEDGDALKARFRQAARAAGLDDEALGGVVFIFAKDRLENWVEFLLDGQTDESREGPRAKSNRSVAEAARALARHCDAGKPVGNFPPSLQWSCANWRSLAERMRAS